MPTTATTASTSVQVRAASAPGEERRSPNRRRGNRQRAAQRTTLSLLAAPSIVLLLLINAYPLAYAAFQSMRDGSLIDAGDFVGLSNYGDVLTDPAFGRAVRFTLIFVVITVLGSWAVGLVLALLLRAGVPGANVFKVLLLLPWIVPIVVSATSWNWLLATPESPIPRLFAYFGQGQPLFIADPTLARITVCVFEIWVNFSFMMLMNTAALAAVDPTVYEAARVDGASPVQQFRHLTLPLISRSTYISWILMTIFIVNDFPTVYLLTSGGPVDATTTLVILAYRTVFENFQVGPGVAIAFLMSLTLVVVSVVLYRQVRKAHV